MVVEKIYFDMDGVLADFNRGIRELCHREPINQMTSTKEDDRKLWDAVRQVDSFYDKLEVIPGGKVMFDALWERYGDRCEILSGIPKPNKNIPHPGEDKKSWMARIFGPEVKVNIVYREEKKERCNGEGCILIDDYQKNINEWEAYGGTGILFRDADSAMKQLQDLGIL